MMELSEAVRIGYRDALVNNLTINGNVVSVYNNFAIPENAETPYVIISTFTANQRFTDTCKVIDCTQLVDVVTSFTNPTGQGQAENIANQIENIINPDTKTRIDITDYGYAIGNTYGIGSDQNYLKSNDRYIYRILKRYRHIVEKINLNNT